jgi:glucose-1-phosphate thymidylyltransferase
MNKKGRKLSTGKVREWLDCGNKDATVYSNQRVLINTKKETLIHPSAQTENAIIIQPSYIGDNVVISNSVIGPYASIGKNSVVESCIIRNSIIQTHTVLRNKLIEDSMIGNHCDIQGKTENVSIGDFTRTL